MKIAPPHSSVPPGRLDGGWLWALLAICGAATLGIGLWMAQPWASDASDARGDGAGWATLAMFLLWAISPLIAMGVVNRLSGRVRPRARIFSRIALAVLAVGGVTAYVDAAWVHPDAQGGLVFVSVPVLQWLATLCVAGICVALRERRTSG